MIKEIGPDPFSKFNNKVALPPAQEIPKEVLEQNNTQPATEQNFDMYNQQANMTTMAQQVQPTQPNVYSQQMDMTNQQMNMSNIAQPVQPNPYDQQMNMANMTQPMQTNTVPPVQPNSYNQQMSMTNMTQQMQPMQQNAYNQQMNMAQPMQQTMYTPQNNMVPPIQPNVYNQMSMTQPVQTQPSFNIPAVEDTTPVDNTTPAVNNVTPVVDNTAPVVNNTPPVVNNTPVVDNTAPVIDNTVPVVNSTVPVVDNTINNIAPTVDNTVPVVENTAPVVDNTAISAPISAPTLTKLNITPANVPNKKLTDCNLDELLAAVSDIVSENCYQYINKVLGNDIEIATLSDTPSKAECANLLNSIPLTINSVEKWIAVETELEKNAELYKKASDWVTSTIKENASSPKYSMGRSDIVIGLYRKYYNSTEDLTQTKKTKSSKAESDSKESDLTESGSEQPKPKRTRSSKKKNNTVADTQSTVPLIEQPNQTPVEQAIASTVPQQMTQPANFSMPTPMEQTVTQTTPVTSTTANDTSTMPFEW